MLNMHNKLLFIFLYEKIALMVFAILHKKHIFVQSKEIKLPFYACNLNILVV